MKKEYLKTGRTHQKTATRDRILSGAQEYINSGKSFTLEEIAESAGLSRATVYRYFSNADTLAAEAGLNINTKSPELIYEDLKQLSLADKLLGVQDYYNKLALDHEKGFRNYLSILLSTDSQPGKRGARRVRTLQLVLENSQLSEKEKRNLRNLLTILMGIEPVIVAKDVCGLNSSQTKELLQWGMQLILNGTSIGKLQ
jgi:AcrR family transcriptional regulator